MADLKEQIDEALKEESKRSFLFPLFIHFFHFLKGKSTDTLAIEISLPIVSVVIICGFGLISIYLYKRHIDKFTLKVISFLYI